MTRIVVTALLPVACVWAARHETTILRRGVALSAAQADKTEQIGVVHPDKVRLLAVDVIPPTNRLLRTVGAKLGFVCCQTIGMTLRYGIFIQPDHWGDRRLLVHELTHVAKYERFGGFRTFLFQYLQNASTRGIRWGIWSWRPREPKIQGGEEGQRRDHSIYPTAVHVPSPLFGTAVEAPCSTLDGYRGKIQPCQMRTRSA
jgi:hypothetical protein